MCIVQCALHTVQCTQYNIQCAVYSVHCTACIVHCTLYTVQLLNKIDTVDCTMYSKSIQYEIYREQFYIMHSICTVTIVYII